MHHAAIAVTERRLDLHYLITAPYREAKAELMALKGIGDKIADCIAQCLFHGRRLRDRQPPQPGNG